MRTIKNAKNELVNASLRQLHQSVTTLLSKGWGERYISIGYRLHFEIPINQLRLSGNWAASTADIEDEGTNEDMELVDDASIKCIRTLVGEFIDERQPYVADD